MSKFNDLKLALRAKADQNADGKLDKKDIDAITARIALQVDEAGEKNPWGLVAAVAGAVAIIVFAITKFLLC